jgi:RNA polymerase sigma-70 factor (ECF subfamily)
MRSAHAEPAVSDGNPVQDLERPPKHPSLEALVEEHLPFVWRMLCRMGLCGADADDAAQQVFMTAARKLEAIDAGTEKRFLYETARRVAANLRRSHRRRREVPQHSFETAPHPAETPERRAELRRAIELLDGLLAELPPEQARVLLLAEVEQCTVPMIAELEGISVGTAASRLRLARAHFRALLEGVRDRNPFGGAP